MYMKRKCWTPTKRKHVSLHQNWDKITYVSKYVTKIRKHARGKKRFVPPAFSIDVSFSIYSHVNGLSGLKERAMVQTTLELAPRLVVRPELDLLTRWFS